MAIQIETEAGKRLVGRFRSAADAFDPLWLTIPEEPKHNWVVPVRYLLHAVLGFGLWFILSLMLPSAVAIIDIPCEWVTNVLVSTLTYFVIPLIIASLWLAISSNLNAWKLFVVTSLYFTLTTAIASNIGLTTGAYFSPGKDLELPGKSEASQSMFAQVVNYLLTPPWRAVDVVMFIIVLIISTTFIKKVFPTTGKKFDEFFDDVQDFGVSIMCYVLRFMPLLLFCMMFHLGAQYGFKVFYGAMARLLIADVTGMAIYFLLSILLLFIPLRLKVFNYLGHIMPAVGTALANRSSQATLPISQDCARRAGIPESIVKFNLPFGATTNMDGTATAIAVRISFVLLYLGVEVDWNTRLIVTAMVIAGSVGTAAAPGASVAVLAFILKLVGSALGVDIPNEVIVGMVSLSVAVDAVSDPLRTATNVFSDHTSTRWMSMIFGNKDEEKLPEVTPEAS